MTRPTLHGSELTRWRALRDGLLRLVALGLAALWVRAVVGLALFAVAAFVGPSTMASSPGSAPQQDSVLAEAGTGDEALFATPNFFIEAVLVEGARRVTPELLLSEADLQGGRIYSESELRRAAARIDRLPFVQQADFALRRGSERGRYQLVVTVKEIRRFFFGADLVARLYDESVVTSALEADSSDSRAAVLAGVRVFVGDYGVLHFAAGGSEPGFGYTRYRLFGHRALFHLSWAEQRCDEDDRVRGLADGCYATVYSQTLDPNLARWFGTGNSDTWRLHLGWPLRADDTLRLSARWQSSEGGSRRPVVDSLFSTDNFAYQDLEHTRVDLTFLRDTTDDSVMPRTGDRWSAGLSWRRLASDLTYQRFSFFGFPAPGFPAPEPLSTDVVELPRMGTDLLLASASSGRFWPLGERHVVSAALRLGIGTNRLRDYPSAPDGRQPASELELLNERLIVFQGVLRLGHARELYTRRPRSWGRLRWETSVTWGLDRTSPGLELRDRPTGRMTVETGLAISSSWGLFRFGIAYQDFSGGAP